MAFYAGYGGGRRELPEAVCGGLTETFFGGATGAIGFGGVITHDADALNGAACAAKVQCIAIYNMGDRAGFGSA